MVNTPWSTPIVNVELCVRPPPTSLRVVLNKFFVKLRLRLAARGGKHTVIPVSKG